MWREDKQKTTGVLCMCMCALFFRRHPTISSVLPVEANVPRIPPMMLIKAQWTGAEDRHSKRQVCRHPGFFSTGIKGLWSNTKKVTLKWRMAASWADHL